MNANEEKNQLLAALRTLKHTQLLTCTFIDETGIFDNEDLLKTYFDSPLGSKESEQMEEAIVAAVVKSVYASPHIPQADKQAKAMTYTRDTVNMLRYAVLQYQYETEKISAKKYNEIRQKNEVAQRVSYLQTAKRMILRKGGKIVVSAGLGVLAKVAVGAGVTVLGTTLTAPLAVAGATYALLTFGGKLIPPQIKEPLKNEWHRVQRRICDEAVDVVKTLKKKGQQIADRVEPIIEKARDVAYAIGKATREVGEEVVNFAKTGLKKVKSFFGF